MVRQGFWKRLTAGLVLAALATGGVGCHSFPLGAMCCKPPKFDPCCISDMQVPKELNKVSLPPYVIEAPDIILIDAIRVVPLPPYRIEPLDILFVVGKNVFVEDPINGLYPVDPDGTINLGPAYGNKVNVVGKTPQEIQVAVQEQVRKYARNAEITVSLQQSRGVQQISGQHMVRSDGTVGLGSYGSVYITGMTIAQAKAAIEAHLSKYLYKPEVVVDVYAYNSKFYYVITDFAGAGQQVVKLPITGNETVLDSISNIGGLSAVSSKKLWVARPAPTDCCNDQILPVDWCGITQKGQVKTNYQLLPGDRVFIMSQPLTKFDTLYARILAPVQRTLGVTLYATSAYNALRQASHPLGSTGTTNSAPFTPILPIGP